MNDTKNRRSATAMTRRGFTQMGLLLMGTSAMALRGTALRADSGQLVFVNWGGDAGTAYDKAYGQPFEKATGIVVKQDGSGPTEGAIAAQYESGKPSWDIVDVDPFSAETLGKKGIMEPIDYDVVDKAKMRPGFGWEYSASSYFFSYIIAYDAKKYGDTPPTSMADFFDIEKFPGKRAMYKWGSGMWEALLMGDGVAPADLYPLDIERAHKKLAAFKDNIVAYWGGGSESQSLLLNGDASMAIIWSTRARLRISCGPLRSGMAPASIPVLPPCGTSGTPCRAARPTTSATSAVEPGRSTSGDLPSICRQKSKV